MELSKGQLLALQNLAQKSTGADVGWINISDALDLTALGMSERSRSGWTITSAGHQLLRELDGDVWPDGSLIQFGPV